MNSEEFYEQALQIDYLQAAVLREQCALAYLWHENKTAMKAYTQCWGRSARVMAKAYEWFRAEFDDEDTGVEQLRSLVIIAQCGKDKAMELYEEWQGNQTLSPYQWQLKVNAVNIRRRIPKQSVKFLAYLGQVNYIAADATVTAVSQDRAKIVMLEEGGEYEVSFTPRLSG